MTTRFPLVALGVVLVVAWGANHTLAQSPAFGPTTVRGAVVAPPPVSPQTTWPTPPIYHPPIYHPPASPY
jgi:hypothetical protein